MELDFPAMDQYIPDVVLAEIASKLPPMWVFFPFGGSNMGVFTIFCRQNILAINLVISSFTVPEMRHIER